MTVLEKKLLTYRYIISASIFDKGFGSWFEKQNSEIITAIKKFSTDFIKKLGDKKDVFIIMITGESKFSNLLFLGHFYLLRNFLKENVELATWLDSELDKLADANKKYQIDHPYNKKIDTIVANNYARSFITPGYAKAKFFQTTPKVDEDTSNIRQPQKRTKSAESELRDKYRDAIDEIIVFVNAQKYNFEQKKSLNKPLNENEEKVLTSLENLNKLFPEEFENGNLTLYSYTQLARNILKELLNFAQLLADEPKKYAFFENIFMTRVNEYTQALTEINAEETEGVEETPILKRSKSSA